MDEWIKVLQRECKRSSQNRVAQELGVSTSVINQCLKGTYSGRVKRIQSLVEGRYMKATVECPVIGELPKDRCMDFQARRNNFAATNPVRVQLHQACPTCPNFQGGES
ncbi:MAG: XRE family transcriptional regulator [Gammaproteobacteria bacterium]